MGETILALGQYVEYSIPVDELYNELARNMFHYTILFHVFFVLILHNVIVLYIIYLNSSFLPLQTGSEQWLI